MGKERLNQRSMGTKGENPGRIGFLDTGGDTQGSLVGAMGRPFIPGDPGRVRGYETDEKYRSAASDLY